MCRRYLEWHSEWHAEAALGRVGGIDMTKEDTDKEDDGGTGGDDTPGGDQAESGGTVGAADNHISDADSGTAGIVDEMPERTLLMRRSPV